MAPCGGRTFESPLREGGTAPCAAEPGWTLDDAPPDSTARWTDTCGLELDAPALSAEAMAVHGLPDVDCRLAVTVLADWQLRREYGDADVLEVRTRVLTRDLTVSVPLSGGPVRLTHSGGEERRPARAPPASSSGRIRIRVTTGEGAWTVGVADRVDDASVEVEPSADSGPDLVSVAVRSFEAGPKVTVLGVHVAAVPD